MENGDVDSEEVSEVPIAELVLTADGTRLLRVRRTVMAMLRARGYIVPDEEVSRSNPGQFGAAFGAAPRRDDLFMCANKASNPNDRILVIFLEVGTAKETVGLDLLRGFAAKLKCTGAARAILVLEKPLTPFAKRFLDQMNAKYKVDVFEEAELVVNIMDSVFVPKHQILLPDEKIALMTKHGIPEGKEEQLPKLSRTDPVARYLGLEKGQIVRVVRPGKPGAKDYPLTTSYRLVT